MSENGGYARETIGYGLIGAGAFGHYSATKYQQMEDVRIVAVADVNGESAQRVAKALGAEAADSAEALLARNDIDIVHIATPPSTHREMAERALTAGKHVLCEKPLALTLDDARQMVDLARKQKRVLAVNLIMRYNPLCEAVQTIVEQELLGQPLHGFFENYAKDEPLGPDHWFWDRSKSGGIFVEHGVHFFDLYRWWLGVGEPRAAQQVKREGADLIEQVHTTVRYPRDVLVNFYHGFTQATRMDRQEMRLVFERGVLRMVEWVPTEMEIECIADDATVEALREILPEPEVTLVERFTGKRREVTSRHKSYRVDGRYLIRSTPGMNKDQLYGHVLKGLLADQIAAIRNPSHPRRVNEENGVSSLETAITAQQLADR